MDVNINSEIIGSPSEKFEEMFERCAKTFQQFAQLVSRTTPDNATMACVPISECRNYQKTYNQELLSRLNGHARDVLHPLRFCLMYLTALLQNESLSSHSNNFQPFLLLRPTLIAFYNNNHPDINMEDSKNLITLWMDYLLDTLSQGRGLGISPSDLPMLGAVQEILASLAECNVYNHFIRQGVSNKLKCCLSYYITNESFKSYIVLHTSTIERLLVTLKVALQIAISKNQVQFEEKQQLGDILRYLSECFEGTPQSQWMNWQIHNVGKLIY